MCNCIEEHQKRVCNRLNGKCYCLSNYTGLRCELSLSTIATETPTQSNRAAIIAGTTAGSVVILLLLITIVVIMAVAIQKLVIHVHKTRDVRLRISPSQEFEKPLPLKDEHTSAAEAEITI